MSTPDETTSNEEMLQESTNDTAVIFTPEVIAFLEKAAEAEQAYHAERATKCTRQIDLYAAPDCDVSLLAAPPHVTMGDDGVDRLMLMGGDEPTGPDDVQRVLSTTILSGAQLVFVQTNVMGILMSFDDYRKWWLPWYSWSMNMPSSELAVRLAPQLPNLRLDHIQTAAESISVTLTAIAATARCPLCGTPSSSVHSSYTRVPADLPWAGYTISLQLIVRRFFCKLATCTRRIFTERLPQLLEPYARRTSRLAQIIPLVAYALGGQAGARLVGRLGMGVSAATLVRLIRHSPEKATTTPRVLGIDDFAFRKGRNYGTILVDHEQHRPVDLLPDRTADTLARWLLAHPGVEVITRDRSTESIRGISLGAPHAQQIADRFHLVANLREALEGCLIATAAYFAALSCLAAHSLWVTSGSFHQRHSGDQHRARRPNSLSGKPVVQ